MRRIAATTAVGFVIALFVCPGSSGAQSRPDMKMKPAKITLKGLAAQVAALEEQVLILSNQLSSANAQNAFALGQFVTVDKTDTINGLAAPHIIFTGANIHLRSGSGGTFDDTQLGNLVIGYDADSTSAFGLGCSDTVSKIHANRSGSHNLIIGDCHEFIGSGGFVAGFSNRILNDSASVSGGRYNDADNDFSSVSGGICNTAGPTLAATNGCDVAVEIGEAASVTAGVGNLASGTWASVNGGGSNIASGQGSTVGGGQSQHATMTGQDIP